jgi:hypothetical protein
LKIENWRRRVGAGFARPWGARHLIMLNKNGKRLKMSVLHLSLCDNDLGI